MFFYPKNYKKNKGFTIIELLVVIAVMVILGAIVIIAMSPGEKLLDARNNQRKAHVQAIYGAVKNYSFHKGNFPTCINTLPSDAIACDEELKDYIASLPQDPLEGSESSTGYQIKKTSIGDDVGVKAVHAEGGEEITAGFWE